VVERLTGDKEEHNRWVGVYIGILAVLLAICGMGGGNAAKDSVRAHVEASNTWAFFQAKNIRRNAINLAIDDLDLMLRTQANLTPEARELFAEKSRDYRAQVEKLTKDPGHNEGLDELFAKGKALEADRDIAMRKDPYFDWSQAMLQIAIVLASIHLIIGSLPLLGLSGGLSLFGLLRLHAAHAGAVLGLKASPCAPACGGIAMPPATERAGDRHDHTVAPAPAR
jgi:hypothetical protein